MDAPRRDGRRPGGPGCARIDERGWWLTRADVFVMAGTLLAAGGVAATAWFGLGRSRRAGEGAGDPRGVGDAGGQTVASSAGGEAGAGASADPASASQIEGIDALVGYADGASTVDVPGAASSVNDVSGTSASGSRDAGALPSGLADGPSGSQVAASDAPGAGLFAVIQNTRGFYEALPLDVDATRTVRSDLGENEVEVSGGAVRVAHSDCKNQVCVDSGWASWPGQVITCLPHQLVVQVVRDPSDAARLS